MLSHNDKVTKPLFAGLWIIVFVSFKYDDIKIFKCYFLVLQSTQHKEDFKSVRLVKDREKVGDLRRT